MSFYDDASLVVIPSGYKTSKVYAEKPTDGSGDLAFTRTGDTATRVNSAGLVEKVRTNLLTYSQNFTSAGGWSVIGGSVATTANYGTAPDGTQTSTRIVFSGANEIWAKSVTGATGIGVFSLWIKGTAGQTILITYGGTSDKTLTLGAGWNRFNTDGNAAISTQMFINTYGGATARDIEVWGGQTELGDIATDYIPTTTAAVSVGPVANLPRLDYLGSTCPRLLLEPQRTNLNTYSEQLDNAAWTKQSTTVTANAAVSPDGYTNADKLIASAANAFHAIFNVNATLTGNHTFSFYAKKSEYDFITAFDQFSGRFNASFNLNTGVVSSGSGASIQSVGNGWYRCIVSFDGAASAVISSLAPSPTAGTVSYLGDGTSGVLVYGCQLEAGAYATSYIPTLAASATRVADAASKTGISSLIGQTEGTLFVDAVLTGKDSANGSILLATDKVSSGAIIRIIYTNANALRFDVFDGTSFVCQISAGAYNVGSRLKIAGAYKANDFILYVNGTQIGTDTNGTVPTTDVVNINTSIYGDTNGSLTNQALLFKTRLTNAELATLTTI